LIPNHGFRKVDFKNCAGLVICPEEYYRAWCVLSVIVKPQ